MRPLVSLVESYLSLTFLPLFSANSHETQYYETRANRVLKAIKQLENPEHSLGAFWHDYCRDELEFLIEPPLAEVSIKLLHRAWSTKCYPSLYLVRYLAQHMPTFVFSLNPFVLDSPRRQFFTLTKPEEPLLTDFILTTYSWTKMPEFHPAPLNRTLFERNLSLALNFCFRETEYPTSEGLVTAPINIDLTQWILEKFNQLSDDDKEFIKLMQTFEQRIDQTKEVLSSFLYR
jgi:hypothetical protein